MRFATSLVALIAFATSGVLAASTPTLTKKTTSLNPDFSVVQANAAVAARAPEEPWTNAKRLAQGLPPRAPHRRPNKARRSQTSSTPVKAARGYIMAIDAKSLNPLGYVQNKLNAFGEFGYVTSSQNEALTVSFSYDPLKTSLVDLAIASGGNTPFLGGITGYSSDSPDLSASSSNYAYLGKDSPTAQGATPAEHANSFTSVTGIQEDIESWIWKFHPLTQTFTAQWVNSDGSQPKTNIVLATDENVFALTGDIKAFRSDFGSTQHIHFGFVSA